MRSKYVSYMKSIRASFSQPSPDRVNGALSREYDDGISTRMDEFSISFHFVVCVEIFIDFFGYHLAIHFESHSESSL